MTPRQGGIGCWLMVAGLIAMAGRVEAESVLAPEAEGKPSGPPKPAVAPAEAPASQLPLFSQRPRDALYRLASVPNMFGDFYRPDDQVLIDDPKFKLDTGALGPLLLDIPSLGAGRVKMAENNKALTMDRVYINYSHFHNTLKADPDISTPGQVERLDIDRYVLGGEKMFADGLWSIEVRLPLLDAYDFRFPVASPLEMGIHSGSVGNLTVALKRQLLATEDFALATGFGVETPTGIDARGVVYNHLEYAVDNRAVHLHPYLAAIVAPTDRLFCHAFGQLDVATNGNPVRFTSPLGVGSFGTLSVQNLLLADVGTGYWLRRDPDARLLTGLATLLELHYTTTLQGSDVLPAFHNGVGLTFRNCGDRVDIVDLTVGVHAEFAGNTLLRTSGVFPLAPGGDRPFDAEVQVQVERRF